MEHIDEPLTLCVFARLLFCIGRSDSNGVFEFFLTRLSTPYVPNLSFDNAVNDLFQTSTKRSLDKIEMPYTKSTQNDSGPNDWSW